mmetsp:Transcript_23688/g.74700  ORF Transcript_23688/g.74700 Transcript_23688/m.74700 type:complete len:201 (-) Transcript_23688:7-609(-)
MTAPSGGPWLASAGGLPGQRITTMGHRRQPSPRACSSAGASRICCPRGRSTCMTQGLPRAKARLRGGPPPSRVTLGQELDPANSRAGANTSRVPSAFALISARRAPEASSRRPPRARVKGMRTGTAAWELPTQPTAPAAGAAPAESTWPSTTLTMRCCGRARGTSSVDSEEPMWACGAVPSPPAREAGGWRMGCLEPGMA